MFAVTHAEPVRVGVRSTRIGPATPAAPRWMCIAIGASMLLCRWATHTWPLAGPQREHRGGAAVRVTGSGHLLRARSNSRTSSRPMRTGHRRRPTRRSPPPPATAIDSASFCPPRLSDETRCDRRTPPSGGRPDEPLSLYTGKGRRMDCRGSPTATGAVAVRVPRRRRPLPPSQEVVGFTPLPAPSHHTVRWR